MKQLGKIITYLMLACNALFVGVFIVSAYSPLLHPSIYPLASCLGLAFPVFLSINILFFIFWLFINYRFALLPLLGVLICIPQIRTYMPLNTGRETPPEGSIKLLSYNVMSFSKLKKKDGKNPVLNYLANSGADIICLQEYKTSNNRKFITDYDVRKALKAYPYRSIRQQGKGEVELACFSKFPILSTRPVKYKSSYNGSMCYTIKVDSDTLMLINNHLESNKLTTADRGMYENMIKEPNTQKVKTGLKQLIRKLAEAAAIRAPQADSLAKMIERSKYSTVIACGDFNDSPISYPHHTLTRQLEDAFRQAGNGFGISYNQNKFYFRIDNILISRNLKAYHCTVDRSIKASDHYPIWCYISKR